MAGTLFGLSLSQNVDVNGRPLAGAFLFIYNGGTLTPASSYQDTGLTVINPFPLVADANGRIPQFWLADGTYRARLTDANLIQQYDIDGILAIGASSGGGGGGGGGVAINGFTTGDMIFVPTTSGTRTGFVRCNARTIGSAASGATERANTDTNGLYAFLWNGFPDGTCPVSGGRGVSAAADFSANKPIGLLDMRGRGPFGLDDMGNSAAGRISGGTGLFGTGGASTVSILQTHLAAFTLPNTLGVAAHHHTQQGTMTSGNNSADHTHGAGTLALNSTAITNGTGVARNVVSRNDVQNSSGQTALQSATSSTISLTDGSLTGTSGGAFPATHTHDTVLSGNTSDTSPAVTGGVTSGGSGTALTTISPYALGCWIISL